ncbi:MAG: ATP-binding protein [Elusimicrobiota bacterium]
MRVTEDTLKAWQEALRQFKEKIAERLWALPGVSETEKEILFREYLSDLDGFEKNIGEFSQNVQGQIQIWKDENDLLRSIMGVGEDELKTKTLTLDQDRRHLEREKTDIEEEAQELRRRVAELNIENETLRKKIRDFQQKAEDLRIQQLKSRENDVRYFAENHEALKDQLKDLESRLTNMRSLFAENNQTLATQKQEEISLVQKKLLDEMEIALRRKQELSWAEEDMFANGVAHRVRTALVSTQGQLLLTLERLGLLDPESTSEAFWRTRFKLFVEGAGELSQNFKSIQGQIQEVTSALDDYLHLTGRRLTRSENILIKDVVEQQLADIYANRKPSLSVEFLSDDPMPGIQGDPALVSFILKTLLINALEAIPGEAGRITISLKNQTARKSICVLIKDSGTGISDHLVKRIFQPFFTTKEHRQGLNLSRSRRYAEVHGGSLQLIQTSSSGTTFQLELPYIPKSSSGLVGEGHV